MSGKNAAHDRIRTWTPSDGEGGVKDRTAVLDPLVGTCAYLNVVSVIESGAFLDCGLPKDLFVPVGEQQRIMKPGESHVVCIFRNEKTGRVAGSSRLNKFIKDEATPRMKAGTPVDLLICAKTDLGYKAIVANECFGLLFKNEIFQGLHVGMTAKGFIKKIRPDGRIDLGLHLQRPGMQSMPDVSEKILAHLKAAGGSGPFTDKTSPAEIYRLFSVSKKKFKIAVGNLYKARKITIEPDGIKLAGGQPTAGEKSL